MIRSVLFMLIASLLCSCHETYKQYEIFDVVNNSDHDIIMVTMTKSEDDMSYRFNYRYSMYPNSGDDWCVDIPAGKTSTVKLGDISRKKLFEERPVIDVFFVKSHKDIGDPDKMMSHRELTYDKLEHDGWTVTYP